MSVVIAVKSGGAVYMCCDTQSTAGKQKVNLTQDVTCKISRLSSGMLVGVCGKVIAHQRIYADESIFDFAGDTLKKSDIVNSIIPKIEETLKNELIEGEDKETLPCSLILAYKDKLFEIMSDYTVVYFNDYCAAGGGMDFTFASLDNKNLSVRDRLLQAVRASAKHCDSVSAPFALIDTDKLEYEFVEE